MRVGGGDNEMAIVLDFGLGSLATCVPVLRIMNCYLPKFSIMEIIDVEEVHSETG
jgi:hypothetical protein